MRIATLIFLVLVLVSCGSTNKSKTSHPTVRNEVKETRRTLSEMDTLMWTEVDRSKDYAKAVEELIMDKKERYNVSLLFPFEIAKNNKNDIHKPETKLGRMVHYYSGVLMALKQLEEEGVNIDLNVLDAESGLFDDKLQRCKASDVIIGPRDSKQLSVAANFGKVNEIVVVSPWKSGAKISEDNPYFVQLRPGLKEHFDAMIEHALQNFEPENIFILGRKDQREDRTYFRYLQSTAAGILESEDRKVLNEYFIEEDSLIYGKTAFDSVFVDHEKSCFLLPHWSFSSDEDFVYNVARKLNGERGLKDVTLYGMPILFETDKIKFELYRNLKMRICRSSYVDRTSNIIREFRERYFEEYRDFPAEEALEGYDMMLFIGRSLFNYGTKFQFFLDSYASSLLQTRYDIQKIYDPDSGDDFKHIQYFQNRHLYILSFEEDKFVAN